MKPFVIQTKWADQNTFESLRKADERYPRTLCWCLRAGARLLVHKFISTGEIEWRKRHMFALVKSIPLLRMLRKDRLHVTGHLVVQHTRRLERHLRLRVVCLLVRLALAFLDDLNRIHRT